MTPRERVLRCLNHEQSDRVPLDGTFRPEVWEKLKEHFGTNDTGEITETLGLDFRGAGMGMSHEWRERSQDTPLGRCIPHPDGSHEDEWGTRQKQLCKDSPYVGYVYQPLADESNLDTYKFPDLDAPGRWEGVQERIQKLKENYVVSAGVSTFFRQAWDLRGLEAWLMDLCSNERFVVNLLDRLLEYKVETVRRFAEMGVDMISVGGDIAMHTNLFMSPEIWRKYLKPRDAQVLDAAKKYGVEHFYFHTDGNLMPVMEDLIEIGFDIFDPIQPECMDPYEVKERWGDKITLHGTISSQQTMPFGTPDDVRGEVRERIARCGQNGGLVISPNNVVQYDVPLENLLAMYDEVKKIGLASNVADIVSDSS